MAKYGYYVNPIQSPESWDYLTIGGVVVPLLCKVEGPKRAYEWQVNAGRGAMGATIVFVQRPPSKFTVTFSLWRSQDFDEWKALLPSLKFDPTKNLVRDPMNPYRSSAKAISVYHPILADVDIRSAVVEEITGIQPQGGGLYTVSVSFLEYWAPPKINAVVTAAGAVTDPAAITRSVGVATREAVLAALHAEAKAP